MQELLEVLLCSGTVRWIQQHAFTHEVGVRYRDARVLLSVGLHRPLERV
jgi:hypothetical protein